MIRTTDITWLIFLLVYGVDGCLTIVHRIMLHENLGEAHRKHAYQIMANELKVGHVKSFIAVYGYAVSDFFRIYQSLSRYGVCSLVISGGCISCIGYCLHIVHEKILSFT